MYTSQNPSTTAAMQTSLAMSQAMELAFTALSLPLPELSAWLTAQIEANPLLELPTSYPQTVPLFDLPEASSSREEYILEMRCALPRELHRIGYYLLSSIDAFGALDTPLEKIAESLNVSKELVESVITRLQRAFPDGYFTFSTKEALRARFSSTFPRDEKNTSIAIFTALLNADPKTALKQSGLSFSELKKKVSHALYAKTPHEFSRLPVPDIILDEVTFLPEAEHEALFLPAIRLKPLEISVERSNLAKAKWLIRIIEKRRRILLEIGKLLSKSFSAYCSGASISFPELSINEVSEKLGLHESTIKRAIQRKYVQSPIGLHPLPSFFSGRKSALKGAAAQELLKQLIACEPKRKPLSDEKLAVELSKRGVVCSRKTAAKYRSEAGIPSASLRKNT